MFRNYVRWFWLHLRALTYNLLYWDLSVNYTLQCIRILQYTLKKCIFSILICLNFFCVQSKKKKMETCLLLNRLPKSALCNVAGIIDHPLTNYGKSVMCYSNKTKYQLLDNRKLSWNRYEHNRFIVFSEIIIGIMRLIIIIK